MQHFIHYTIREIKDPARKDLNKSNNDKPFYAERQNPGDGFARPMYHITRSQSGPVKNIKKGSVIWIFSVVKSPWGTLPPSLDAMMIVERKAYLQDGRTKLYAAKESKWFPLYDATQILNNLKTVNKNGNEKELWTNRQKPVGLFLQSIRQLNTNCGLQEWSDKILHAEFDFISYRIKDGTEYAFEKAKHLIKEGKVVFWDRFSLPRRLVERREFVCNNALDQSLMGKIKDSARVWGIETPHYFAPESYSQKEANLAKRLNKYYSFKLK